MIVGMYALCVLLIFGCADIGKGLSRYEYSSLHMGVRARIVLYSSDESSAAAAARAAFDRIAELEDVMSDYRPDSEVSRLVATAHQRPVRVSDDLWRVLAVSKRIGVLSDGSFDVTAGAITHLWRRARRTGVLPTDAEVERARRESGWRLVTMTDDRAVRLASSSMVIDFGGIGKGLAAQEASEVLRRHGHAMSLVDLGGDLMLADAPPGRDGWSVAIGQRDRRTERLANCAVAASGDAEQRLEVGGIRYSHIVDPRTGWALTDAPRVTVIAPTGWLADAIASAVSVLGADETDAVRALTDAYPDVHLFVER